MQYPGIAIKYLASYIGIRILQEIFSSSDMHSIGY